MGSILVLSLVKDGFPFQKRDGKQPFIFFNFCCPGDKSRKGGGSSPSGVGKRCGSWALGPPQLRGSHVVLQTQRESSCHPHRHIRARGHCQDGEEEGLKEE